MDQTKTQSEAPKDVLITLRLEGALVATIAIYLYSMTDAGWLLFALLILAPDLSAFGYVKDRVFGAKCYNAAHTYLAPALLWAILTAAEVRLATPLSLVWVVHIGADRLLGYGLKFPQSFKRTHLSFNS